jgi:6-phosphogluconate dehydrogenase
MSPTQHTTSKPLRALGSLLHLKQQDRIGWIGLGQMGYYMARNLQGYLASRSLTMNVWNRSPAKSAKMHHHGARESKTIEDLVANSNIVNKPIAFIYSKVIGSTNQTTAS